MANVNLSSISSKSFLIGTRSITAIYNTYGTYTDGKYVDDDGSIVDFPDYAISGLIPVSEGDVVTIPIHLTDGTGKHGAMYSSVGDWVAKLNTQTVIPSGVSSIKFNLNKTPGLLNTVCFIEKADYEKHSEKVVVCDGDSITHGYLSYKPYPTFLGESLNQSVVNLGVGGERISNLLSRISSVPIDVSQSIINIGYNDFDQATTLGTISDSTNATFYGCLNLVIDWYRKNRIFCELYFCNLLRSPNSPSVGGGSTLKQLSDAIVLACANKGIKVIDTWNCGLNFADSTSTLMYSSGDHCHPNSFGNMMLSRVIYRSIV